MFLKTIYFVVCTIGIVYGARGIYMRRIRVILWTMREPGDRGYDDDAVTVTGLPAIALGAATIALCLYMFKEHVL